LGCPGSQGTPQMVCGGAACGRHRSAYATDHDGRPLAGRPFPCLRPCSQGGSDRTRGAGMERIIFTGIKPTGRLTLGNYFGALRRIAAAQQQEARCIYSVVDLHAMTVPHDPARLRALTREAVTLSLAAGLDPTKCVLFRQSDVPAHTELSYLLECTAYMGELNRMIQFKEKGRGRPQTRVSLLTYPVLMAADILLYGTTEVPVGDDQRQHLELARDLAVRF